jgi:hypothetical protein
LAALLEENGKNIVKDKMLLNGYKQYKKHIASSNNPAKITHATQTNGFISSVSI